MKLLILAPLAAALHITPVVVLVKRPDAVQALLPGADAYFAREVHLSQTDAHRLHQEVDWSPEDGVLTLYTGKTGSTVVGALEFVRVDTPHGPIEVAVGFTPQGMVRGVIVTKATDRKSTRLNSSHLVISYAVFCLKKKKKENKMYKRF